jgi:hypothetical protein
MNAVTSFLCCSDGLEARNVDEGRCNTHWHAVAENILCA